MAVTQSHYRFGTEDGTEATHGWHAAEDANPAPGTIALDTTFFLRFTLQCDATLQSNVDAEFQCRKNGGAYQNITTTSTIVKAVTTAIFANAANTTKRLSGTGTFEASSQGCTHDGIGGGAQMDIVASGNAETMCSLQLVSADVAPGDLIEFRLTRDGGVLLDTYAVTPALTIPVTAAMPVGALSLTGVAPALAFAMLLSAGSLALAGQPVGVVFHGPDSGVLTLEGYAPTVAVGGGTETTITIPAGALAFTGNASTLTYTIDLTAGTLTLTGFAPTPAQAGEVTILVPVGALAVTGTTSILAHGLNLPIGALTFTGQAAAVVTGQGLAIPAGSLSLVGTTAILERAIALPVGTLTLTGLAPALGITGQVAIAIPAGALTFTGPAPSLQLTFALAVPAGALSLTGTFVTLAHTISLSAGTLVLTGQIPTAVLPAVIGVPVGSLAFAGSVPVLTLGGGSVWRPIARLGQRYTVTVGGSATSTVLVGSVTDSD